MEAASVRDVDHERQSLSGERTEPRPVGGSVGASVVQKISAGHAVADQPGRRCRVDPTVIKCKKSPQLTGEPFALVKRYGKVRRDGFKGNHNNARWAAQAARNRKRIGCP